MTVEGRKDPAGSIREQAVDWLLRREEGLSAADRRALDAWLEADAAHRMAFERAARLLGDADRALRADPEQTRRSIRRRHRVFPAAILIGCLLAGGALFAALDGPLRLAADVVSGSAEMPLVRLADGSTVHLNASSAIDERFDATLRVVTLLKGEGYFEVASDRARPFVVEVGALRIEALGTAFNVNLVGDRAEVTVTQSSVSVVSAAIKDAIRLDQGMRLMADADGRLGAIEAVSADSRIAWRARRLTFEERPLPLVVAEIGRHLPGRIVIANPSLERRRISGSFDLADPAAALDSFAAAFGLTALRAGPLLTVIY